MKTRTIRMPDTLEAQISQMALVSRRSFTAQVILMLEQAIDGSVESDLRLIQEMRGKLHSSEAQPAETGGSACPSS